jgi:hypothetical protein
MPKGSLVIGVGGTGKGVLNWLKRTLEEDGDGTENVKLLCIDSAALDQYYAFPASKKYYLDLTPNSKEFFMLNKNPVPVYQKIRNNKEYPFISEWLSAEDAKNSSDTTLTTEGGLGQNRVAGRAVFFLSADEVYSKIADTIDSLIGGTAHQVGSDDDILWDIFIVGSPTGGTGSGCFIDTANLVRKIISEKTIKGAKLIGIIALPECFDKVFNDPNEVVFKDARSFAFYREVVRMMYANWNPINFEYSKGLEVNNQLFFDFCFLVNGANNKVNLGSEIPMFGVCPTISDFIFALIKDPGSIHANLRNDITKLESSEPSSKFSTFGITKLLFPYKDIVNTFKYKFVHDLMSELTKDSPDISIGESEANQFLQGFKFTQSVLNYKSGKNVKIAPPNSPAGLSDLIDMINSFHTGVPGKDQIFPSTGNSPVRQIRESVEYTTSFFHRVSNQDVINQCEKDLNDYLGSKANLNFYTVHGWANHQKGLLLKAFEESLFEQVKNIFYDIAANDYKKLSQTEPNILMKGYKFLESVKESCTIFSDYINNEVKNYNKLGNPVDIQKGKVEKLKDEMLKNPEATDKSAQLDFIQEFQILLGLHVWFILLEEFKDVSTGLSEIAEKFWLLFGDPAKGWVNTLLNSIIKTEANLNDIVTLRKNLKDDPTRQYYPTPGSNGENKIYEDYVLDKGYLAKILNEMSWIFTEGETPRTYELQLKVPSKLVQSGEFQNITYAFSGVTKWAQVSEFDLGKFFDFAETFIGGELKNFNLWLAMSYDLNNNGSLSPENFAKQSLDYFVAASNPLLAVQEAIKAEYLEKSYYISSFISPESPVKADEIIADYFSSNLADKIIEKKFDRFALAISFKHKIPYQNWVRFEIVLNNYLRYLDQNNFPIHAFPEEKNASFIENYLKTKFHQRRNKPINPKIVSVLKNKNDLQAFVLAYLFGILDSEFKQHEKPKDNLSPFHYVITGKGKTGIPFDIDLGEIKDILGVMKEYMKKENSPARDILQSSLNQYLESLSNTGEELGNLFNVLNEKEFNLEPNLETDLKDVFRVIIQETIEKL